MTAGAGHTEGRRSGSEQIRAGRADGIKEGAGREQGGRRDKKEYVIFKGEKERKTPLRLAKACKCVYIHCTQYRGVSAVYCTFFYILEGYYIYLYIYYPD